MNLHPSLKNTASLPPPIFPRRVMDPYVPCWCNSGKKWKFCHKDRHKQTPINTYEHVLDIRKKFNLEYCSHPESGLDSCSTKIIRSHTIQRNGGLGDISDPGHHVISFKSAYEDLVRNRGELKPRKIGYKIASTFLGFCDFHDCSMFRSIEINGFQLNSKNAFLLAFRAMAYELYTKEVALTLQPVHRELDRGLPFERQAFIQEYFYYYFSGTNNGLRDLRKLKSKYDEAFISSDFSDFYFYGIEFSEKLPVVSCSAFYPEFDFNGKPLQIPISGSYELQHITLNLTVINGVSVAILGWPQEAHGPTLDFIKSIHLIPEQFLANALVLLAFEHLENTYANPEWWESLSSELQAFIINKTQSGLGAFSPERNSQSFNYKDVTLANSIPRSRFFSPNLIEQLSS